MGEADVTNTYKRNYSFTPIIIRKHEQEYMFHLLVLVISICQSFITVVLLNFLHSFPSYEEFIIERRRSMGLPLEGIKFSDEVERWINLVLMTLNAVLISYILCPWKIGIKHEHKLKHQYHYY